MFALILAGILMAHPDDPAKLNEHAAMLALVPVEQVTVTAQRSGRWADPSTWGGNPVNANGQTESEYYLSWFNPDFLRFFNAEQIKQLINYGKLIMPPFVPAGGTIPKDGDRVHIPIGVTVTLDGNTSRLHWLRVDGQLLVEATANTRINVETLVVTPDGYLQIGTFESPISATANIVFLDRGPLTNNLGRGLISHGAVSIHGWPVETWGALGTIANADIDTTQYGTPPDGFTHYEANLKRNVTFRSESLEILRRGHVMLMHSANVSVGYARFTGLGRTNKSIPLDGNNGRGRYAFHAHRCGPDAISVTGIVVDDSPGWGFVNHSSNVIATNCISYNVVGAGMVAEAGDELGEYRNCLAVRSTGSGQSVTSRSDIGDFGHGGHGFWLQSTQVKLIDNVSCGHPDSAFQVYGLGYTEPDTGVIADPDSPTKTLAGYSGNLAFGSGTGHFLYWGFSADNVFENSLTWGCSTGIQVRKAAVDTIGGSVYGAGTGIHYVSGYGGTGNVRGVRIEKCKVGLRAPTVSDATVDDCQWINNRYDVFVTQEQTGGSLALNGVTKLILNPDSVRNPAHFHGALPRPIHLDGKQAYFANQASNFIPFPVKGKAWPEGVVGLTNLELFDKFGVLPGGALATVDAVEKDGYLIAP